MRPQGAEIEDDFAAEEENKLINEVRKSIPPLQITVQRISGI
jgi:hypothetical protein